MDTISSCTPKARRECRPDRKFSCSTKRCRTNTSNTKTTKQNKQDATPHGSLFFCAPGKREAKAEAQLSLHTLTDVFVGKQTRVLQHATLKDVVADQYVVFSLFCVIIFAVHDSLSCFFLVCLRGSITHL